jgi:hypothetical protein
VRLWREAYGILESFCVALEVWSVSFSRTARRFSSEGRRERRETDSFGLVLEEKDQEARRGFSRIILGEVWICRNWNCRSLVVGWTWRWCKALWLGDFG